MAVWFEGINEIKCTIEQIKMACKDHGELFVGVVSLMPGLSSVKLIEQGSDFVTIRTNEGLMKRTNISKHIETESVVVEFDEEYQAGSMVTTKSHIRDEFTISDSCVKHKIVISDVKASGLMGFFYRIFGKSSTGNAFMSSYKTYFEK